jgi:hypothetical protein
MFAANYYRNHGEAKLRQTIGGESHFRFWIVNLGLKDLLLAFPSGPKSKIRDPK